MTAQLCTAITRSGAPCQAHALADSDYCFHHDPARADERRLARSKGGRARHGRRIGPVAQVEPLILEKPQDILALLQQVIHDTRNLENSIQRNRTLGYLCARYSKAYETAVLDARIAELERTLKWREEPQ